MEFLNLLFVFFNLIFIGKECLSHLVSRLYFHYINKELSRVNNYRGIVFTDSIAKIFTGVLLNRLQADWLMLLKF